MIDFSFSCNKTEKEKKKKEKQANEYRKIGGLVLSFRRQLLNLWIPISYG